jgi:hypothetical protein
MTVPNKALEEMAKVVVDDGYKFDEYYKDLSSKTLKYFKSGMDKTKTILFRVVPSSIGLSNITKMELENEKEEENRDHYRKISMQDRIHKHLQMPNIKVNARRGNPPKEFPLDNNQLSTHSRSSRGKILCFIIKPQSI